MDLYENKLYTIGILILVNHNVPKSLLPVLQNIRMMFKKLNRLVKQIIEIKRIIVKKNLLIFPPPY